jgi:hypothetical protein
MPLLDQVRDVLDRLAPLGWGDLFMKHGLDTGAADLDAELAKPLDVRRSMQGFEDFALEGHRGVEPGAPARSLVYHALASPRVQEGPGIPVLEDFPTLAEIDVVENYVFAAGRPTLDDLRARADNRPLAVVVFAYEYRPASHTCHKRHADLVFARTGVSRVGDAPPLYRARFRGFVPFVEEDAHAIRVSPARFGAFLAVQKSGDRAAFCPMRFRPPGENEAGDEGLQFWLPVHKLFAGDECIAGLADGLRVELAASHTNEKLRRIHVAFRSGLVGGAPHDGGWSEPEISQPPFRFHDGLAEWSRDAHDPPGVLVPVPQPLVEPATLGGKPLAFNVPPARPFSSSLRIPDVRSALTAPEYVHVRTVVEDGGTRDLNAERDVAARVRAGGYQALHYLDHTADGAITAACSLLDDAASGVARSVAAYSLVAAPDFFFLCDQRELTEWTEGLPASLRKSVWNIEPATLSDQRAAANLQLPGEPFDPADRTCTAIVSLFGRTSQQQTNAKPQDVLRHSYLPDDAAGTFAPGWDISFDRLPDGTEHFAAYGLGSPFPEDAKLCAALSTFWPAAAPDATRTFTFGALGERYFTVAPLTDEEIGQVGDLPWDGVPGPRLVQAGGETFAEYASFDHTDYVRNALDRRFSLRVTTHIDADEYQRRVLAMELAYRVLEGKKITWVVLSFRRMQPGDPALAAAEGAAGMTLPGRSYRFEIFARDKNVKLTDELRERMPVRDLSILFVDPENRRTLRSLDGSAFTAVQHGPF